MSDGKSGFEVGQTRKVGAYIKNKFLTIYSLFFVFAVIVSADQLRAENNIQNELLSIRTPESRHCPSSENFNVFIGAYAEDINLQKASTIFPLEKLTLVDVQPEPKPFVRLLQRRHVRFPIFPNSRERVKNNLKIRIELVGQMKNKVIVFKDDTDYQVVYFFKRKDCWTLVRIEDWSL